MLELVLTVVLTAVLSSLLTLGIAALYYRRVLEPKLREQWQSRQEEVGDLVQARVRAGVLDALQSVAKGDPLVSATRSVTKTGASLMEEGLGALFGAGERRRNKP